MSSSPAQPVQYIVSGSPSPGLTKSELSLLRRKQSQLIQTFTSLETKLTDNPKHLRALKSTWIFAQHEAGTAICIDPRGYLLTCSHCIGETRDEWHANRRKWLLSYSGTAVHIECQAWDSTRDLALLKIIAIESSTTIAVDDLPQQYNFITLSPNPMPKLWTPIFCFGQPGAEDLESASYRKTKYNLLEMSEGRYRGLREKGADPQDNTEIGAMRHDAWTYWGHSGAPLCRVDDGLLIGLHSSWDEETLMRHGVPGVAIGAFLEENLPFTSSLLDEAEAK